MLRMFRMLEIENENERCIVFDPKQTNKKIFEKMNCIVGFHSGRHVCLGGLIMVWSDGVW